MKKIQNSYKKSGVNISLANKFVNHIGRLSRKDFKKRRNSFSKDNIGGFGSLFDLSSIKIKDPVIVSSTDGVGTKLEIANEIKKLYNVVNLNKIQSKSYRSIRTYFSQNVNSAL